MFRKVNYKKQYLIVFCCMFLIFSTYAQQNEKSIVQVLESTREKFVFSVSVPELEWQNVKTEYGEFQRILEEDNGTYLRGASQANFSLPETPVLPVLIALPLNRGTDVQISIDPVNARKFEQIRLYPVQKSVSDVWGGKEQDEFEFNEDIYYSSRVDSRQVMLLPLCPESDQSKEQQENICQLVLNLVDYYPRDAVITTYTDFTVTVYFGGEENYFLMKKMYTNAPPMDAVDQCFEEMPNSLHESLANRNVLSYTRYQYEELPPATLFGCRFIIITPPEFMDAANDLKAHKISRGISTTVVSTASIGSSLGEIKEYLTNAYLNWLIKPKWVLLMGDAEYIPTYYGGPSIYDNVDNAGDLFYGQISAWPFIFILSTPVFGIGRFPVDTLEQAQTMVDNVIEYENALFLIFDPYLARMSFAAMFQDRLPSGSPDGKAEREFAETSEYIRNILSPKGLNIQRIYGLENSSVDPQQWRDGTPLPFSLTKAGGFPWDGDGFDIISAVNSGTTLLYHRDHAWWEQWGTPALYQSSAFGPDLDAISIPSSRSPVVYSINCASGVFDNETVDPGYHHPYDSSYIIDAAKTYFCEEFVRKPDGAIAIIGDTRASNTWLNNYMAKGLFDATWPDIDPFGSPTTSIRKLGDILNHAKSYVTSFLGAFTVNEIYQEILIYNLLGDPTLSLRSRPVIYIIENWILQREWIEIELVFEDPHPCPWDPLVVGVAMLEDGNARNKVIGRGVLRSNEIGEKATLRIELTEPVADGQKVKVVLSGDNTNTTTVDIESQQVLRGDANGDGKVDIIDALLTAQCCVGLIECPSPDVADVNCDGRINIVDALQIAQFYVGLLNSFQC